MSRFESRSCATVLDLAEEVELNDRYHIRLVDSGIPLAKEVVFDCLYDLALINFAVVVCVVPVTDNAARGRGGIHRIGRYRILSLAGALSVGV